jgi:hypothetical protein
MKNLTKLWSLTLLLTAAMFMVSCEEDEPTIDVTDGLSVADGYYFVVEGEDPVAEKALLPEKVEGEGFVPTDRAGFFGNYVFLNAGDYQLQKVEAKEITLTIGGTLGAPEVEGEEGYLVAKTTEDGAALSVESDGYYKVSYDETEAELIMMKVEKVSLIGAAIQPNGWSTDTEFTPVGSASDEGFVFELKNQEMRAGEFKIRINNRWTIDRRVERGDTPAGPDNGYVAFTNYGGDLSNLVAGGSNMVFPIESEGDDATITLTNNGGASFESTKVGEVEEIVFDPAENQWAVVGGATDLGWPVDGSCDEGLDMDMNYDGEIDGAHIWSLELNLSNDEFKFRKNDCWDGELGFDQLTFEGPAASNFTNSGGNIRNSTAGIYNVVLTTSDDGVSYTANFELLEETGGNEFDPADYNWGLIGEAIGGWNDGDDIPLEYVGEEGGTHTWSNDAVDFTAAQFKLRANGTWDVNLGFSALTIEGSAADNFVDAGADDNISVVEAGTYSVTLTTSDGGASYVITFE